MESGHVSEEEEEQQEPMFDGSEDLTLFLAPPESAGE